jgi:hypothetical protein
MQVSADVSDFRSVVCEVRDRLAKLNYDGSLDGLIARFEHLLSDLPSDFFVTELVPAIDTGDVEPRPLVIIRAGPRLNALAAALRALDLDVEQVHPAAPPSDTQESVSPLPGA